MGRQGFAEKPGLRRARGPVRGVRTSRLARFARIRKASGRWEMYRAQRTKLIACWVLVSFSFMFADRGAAQTSTTSLQGTVTDPSGAAVANATVELTNADSKTQRDATTDAQGEYHFLFLPPGTYSLSISAIGFSRFEQKGLQLLVNTPSTVNAQLHIGQTSQVITVSDAPPALNMVDASIGDTFNETHVKQIPIEGRNVPDLLSLQPGVAYTGNRPDADKDNDTRGGAVNGARSDQSNVTLGVS